MRKFKKISSLFFVSFVVAFAFAAARPSLDGRAAVAESGTLPSGMFAEAVGFRPGDTVCVTNQLNGKSVDVLVVGALDPSEGFAVLLSPEAAESVSIRKDSNVLVKVSKISSSSEMQTFADAGEDDDEFLEEDSIEGDAEESSELEVPETADLVVPNATEQSEVTEPETAETEQPDIAEEASEAVGTPESENAEPAELEIAETEPSALAEIEKNDTSSEPLETVDGNAEPMEPLNGDSAAENTQNASDESEPAGLETMEPAGNTETAEPETTEPEPAEPADESEFVEPVEPVEMENTEPEPTEPAKEPEPIDEAEPVDDSELLGDTPAGDSVEDASQPESAEAEPETTEPEPSEPLEESELVEATEPVEPETAEPEPTEPVDNAEPERAESSVPEKAESVVPPMPEEEADDISTEEGEHYQPIFLTAADMNPPTGDESDSEIEEEPAEPQPRHDIPEEFVQSDVDSADGKPMKYDIPEEFVVESGKNSASTRNYDIPEEFIVEPAASSKSEPSPESDSYVRNHIVSQNDLKNGKYIQIARLSKASNMRQVLDKISSKYNVFFVPSESERGTTYRVLVGPFGRDVKKALKEMKSLGFKDAFVK
ncbi:MAG: SPOR domain-containing protein [Treponema sp.]|nr:SPOR domain-containing protein [Treponema sp.]